MGVVVGEGQLRDGAKEKRQGVVHLERLESKSYDWRYFSFITDASYL